jgi:diaminopimelate epimerase
MKFTKMHGLGNDYVYINCFEENIEDRPAMQKKFPTATSASVQTASYVFVPLTKQIFKMDM